MEIEYNDNDVAPSVDALYDGVIEYHTGGRIMITPKYAPSLAAWLLTIRERHEKISRQSLRGLTGKSRRIRQGQIDYARVVVSVIDQLVQATVETQDMGAYERARLSIEALLRDVKRRA